MMQRYPSRSQDRGFTLIELLVVVIIIGILAAIAIPLYMNQKVKAHDATLRSDLQSAAKVVQTYIADGGTWAGIRTAAAVTGGITMMYPDGSSPWNDLPGMPRYTASPGSAMVLGFQPTPSVWWSKGLQEGDFCLQGYNINGTYNYTVNGTGAANYGNMLYFDPQLGGTVTVQDVARALDAGKGTSCEGFGVAWKSTRPPGSY